MKYKTFTRQQYLQWCKQNGVKHPLPESKRNVFTESGYPTKSCGTIAKGDVDADIWYQTHW